MILRCIVSMSATGLPGEGWLSRIRGLTISTRPKQRIYFSSRLTNFQERTAGEGQHLLFLGRLMSI